MANAALDRSPRDNLDELLHIELAAADACRRAADAARTDPLTRGAILSFLSEHEQHASALEALGARRPARSSARPSGAGGQSRFESATAALRRLRADAEVAVRVYRVAMERASPARVPVIRAQRNAWLRQRAWLGARIDAFAPRP